MPSIPGQGQGKTTWQKEIAFDTTIRHNAWIIAAIFAQQKHAWHRFPYWHFDLNAGSGHNERENIDGSPTIAVRILHEYFPDRHFCFFVDIDDSALSMLAQRPYINPQRHFLIEGDNADFAQAIPHLIRAGGDNPDKALGSIFCDPNATDLELNALADVARACTRLDIIINAQCTAFKRCGEPLHVRRLPSILNKKHWLIRRHSESDPHQSAMLVGRNFDAGDYKRMGFYNLQSATGQRIAQELEYTEEELHAIRQHSLDFQL